MLAALSLVLLAASGMMPTGRIALAALSGVPVLVASVACGGGYGVGVYAVTALIALLILPGKAMGIAYLTLFGIYPVVQFFLESCCGIGKRARLAAKLAAFLVLTALLGWSAVAFFDLGRYVSTKNLLLASGGSILLFFVYDRGLILVVNMLYKRMKPLLDKVMGRKGNRS